MTKILTDYSNENCARANIGNLFGYWGFMKQSSLVTVDESDGLFLVHMGLTKDQTSIAYQGIMHADLKPEDIDKKIDYVVEYFNSRNMPFMWYICPSTKPDNLGEYLKAHSFNEMDGTPIMAVELEHLVDDRPRPRDFEIKEVTDEATLRLFWDLWYKGYPMPEIAGKLNADIYCDIGYHPDNEMKFFMGYLEGIPVATAFIVLAGGVVGLYGVVVSPDARGRGIGTEMSLYPLRLARSMGYRIGVLDATQQGIGIYRRIGFEEIVTPKTYIYASPENVEQEEKMKIFMHSKRE